MPSILNMMQSLPALILAFELLVGGQARLSPNLTPTLHRRVMMKAKGTAVALYPVPIPIKDPILHTKFVGSLMVTAGLLTGSSVMRGSLVTLFLTLFLTCAGVYSQQRMGIPYWLPVVNSGLAVLVWGIENWGRA